MRSEDEEEVKVKDSYLGCSELIVPHLGLNRSSGSMRM
jgi:hypothetical protein